MIVNTIQNFQRHAFCVCVWREGIWRCMGGWVICECPTEIMFTTSWLIIPPSMTHALTFDSFVLGLGWVGQHKLDESRAVVGIPLPHNWSEGGQRELLSLFFMECLGRNAKMKHYVFLSTPWHTYLYEACKREASLRVTSSCALVSSRWPSKERDGGGGGGGGGKGGRKRTLLVWARDDIIRQRPTTTGKSPATCIQYSLSSIMISENKITKIILTH